MTKERKLWAIYEAVIADLEKGNQGCEVCHDHRVTGRFSRIPRQVDVWITAPVGGLKHDVSIAVECKNYDAKNKVDIKDVDAFCGFLDDVGADKGVLVTTSSFTSGAVARAKGANIETKVLTFEEALEFDWGDYIADCTSCYYSGCWGTVGWHYRATPNGSTYGHCDQCDELYIRCGFCEHEDLSAEAVPLEDYGKEGGRMLVYCGNDDCRGVFTIHYDDAGEVESFKAELCEDEEEDEGEEVENDRAAAFQTH